jgi:predicted AAA+ superfamily ATPase
LQEEIRAEALARNVESFSRFLHTAAFCNAQLVNYEAVARDAQVPARTVREYFQILTDTLIGTVLEPLVVGRKAVSHGKFYFFDIGVANALSGRTSTPEGSAEYGAAFETWIFHELNSWRGTLAPHVPIRFWRTHEGQEVDFVLGDDVAIEAKPTRLASERDCRGLLALDAAHPMRRRILVTRDPAPRRLGSVEVMPYLDFVQALGDLGVR